MSTPLRFFWVALGAYVVVIVTGSLVRNEGTDPRSAEMVVVAVASIVAALWAVAGMIYASRRARELERFLVAESTSIAFFVTMIGAVTYGLLESWLELPRLSAWATWGIGMTTWAVASLVLRRRMT